MRAENDHLPGETYEEAVWDAAWRRRSGRADSSIGLLCPRAVRPLVPNAPAVCADTKLIRDALAELGVAGGPMDPGDDLSDPITLITDPAKSAHNPNNPTITAALLH
jgi:hypothetical protein